MREDRDTGRGTCSSECVLAVNTDKPQGIIPDAIIVGRERAELYSVCNKHGIQLNAIQ